MILFGLADLTQHNVFKTALCHTMCQYFIPFYAKYYYRSNTPHFVYPSSSRWTLGLLLFFGCWETGSLWTFMYKFLCAHMYSFSLSIEELLGHTSTLFNFLKNCQTGFQRGRIILDSKNKYVRLPISQHPCQHLTLSVFSVLFIIVGVE